MNIPLLVVGTASGFSYSLYSAVSKSILKKQVMHPLLLLVHINLFQAALTLLLWVAVRPVFPAREGWQPLLVAGITCAVAHLFLYLALSCGDVSSVMPLMGSKVVFTSVLAWIMLNESHSWTIYVAVLLVAVSVGVLSYSPSRENHSRFQLKPIALMVACCIVFSVTDVHIKRSLTYLDSYNFLIYYNLIIGAASLPIIPYLKKKGVPLRVERRGLLSVLLSAAFLIAATLLFVMALELADGVVVPNILISTRGIFIVLISLVMTQRGSVLLDEQSKTVYALRLAAALLIVFSVVITLQS